MAGKDGTISVNGVTTYKFDENTCLQNGDCLIITPTFEVSHEEVLTITFPVEPCVILAPALRDGDGNPT